MDKARLERRLERANIKVAKLEQLIEEKTRRLFQSNEELARANEGLEQKVVERTAELQQALELAERANRAKDQFLANASHELRTPLHGILSLVRHLLETTRECDIKESLYVVERSGEQLVATVSSILDFEKLGANKVILESSPFPPDEVIEQVRWLFADRASEAGLRLQTINQGLPVCLLGDALRLTQVLNNLVANAIKFTKSGSVSLRVRSEMEGEEATLFWEVEDTGIGIPPERLAVVFDPFEQVDNKTTREFGGTGLGLAISNELVQLMGGSMEVRSVPGEGSTFSFTTIHRISHELPRSREQSVPTEGLGSLRVLVADDHSTNRTVARVILERLGCVVTTVNDGVDVVAEALNKNYDIILMDCHMPRMTGYEAARELKRRRPEGLPIVGLSAGGEAERRGCLGAGMDDFLQKPTSPKELRAVIGRLCAGSSGAVSGTDEASAVVATGQVAQAVEETEKHSFDLVAALELVDGDHALLGRIIEGYLDVKEDYLERLNAAVESRQAAAIAQAAHTIKSAARTLCATELADLAAELEALGRAEATAQVSQALTAVQRADAHLTAIFKERIGTGCSKRYS